MSLVQRHSFNSFKMIKSDKNLVENVLIMYSHMILGGHLRMIIMIYGACTQT